MLYCGLQQRQLSGKKSRAQDGPVASGRRRRMRSFGRDAVGRVGLNASNGRFQRGAVNGRACGRSQPGNRMRFSASKSIVRRYSTLTTRPTNRMAAMGTLLPANVRKVPTAVDRIQVRLMDSDYGRARARRGRLMRTASSVSEINTHSPTPAGTPSHSVVLTAPEQPACRKAIKPAPAVAKKLAENTIAGRATK